MIVDAIIIYTPHATDPESQYYGTGRPRRTMSARAKTIALALLDDLSATTRNITAHPAAAGGVAVLRAGTEQTREPAVLAYIDGSLTHHQLREALESIAQERR